MLRVTTEQEIRHNITGVVFKHNLTNLSRTIQDIKNAHGAEGDVAIHKADPEEGLKKVTVQFRGTLQRVAACCRDLEPLLVRD